MYLIAWLTIDGIDAWASVSGEDAMQEYVSMLCDEGIDEDDIHVFDWDDEIK